MTPGVLSGSVAGSGCWRVCVTKLSAEKSVRCVRGFGDSTFSLSLDPAGSYRLRLYGSGVLTLENVGVKYLTIVPSCD